MIQIAIKKFFVLAAAVLIVTTSAWPTQAQQSAADENTKRVAKAVLPFKSFNFGDVYKGEVISYIFVIRNEGTADLQIKDFTAS